MKKSTTGTTTQALSCAKRFLFGCIVFAIKNTIPKTIVILKITLPTTFATAISLFPWLDAITEAAISGSDVPKATKVAPITKCEILKCSAILSDSFMIKSAPYIRADIAAIKITKSICYVLILVF